MSGSTGFVGRNLIKYLPSKQFNIYPLERSDSKSANGFKWHNLNADSLSTINTIIHLAGKAHDTKQTSASQEYFEVNTELTKKLFDLFLTGSSTTFIFMSSVKAVADTVNSILNEDVDPNPQTAYGKSKQKAEEYLLSQKLPEGKRLFILRPCMIHGPGNKGNLNLLYNFVQKGIPYPLSAYKNERSFLSVDNLNFIIAQIAGIPSIPGGIYNLADDTPLSTNEVVNIIAKENKITPKLWRINSRIINFLARTGDILHLPLNTERLKKLTESYVVSNKKIKKILNITQLPFSAEDGLKLTIRSFHSS